MQFVVANILHIFATRISGDIGYEEIYCNHKAMA